MKTLAQLNQYSTSSVVFTDESLGPGQVLANRYQINGLLDTAKPVMENIEKLCNAAGSWLSYDIHEGKWGVVINQTGTSIASFNDSNIIGNIVVSGTGLEDLYNSVKVEFPHRELRDSADFVTIEIPAGQRNPNEFDNILNVSYDVINDPVQADLLGFIELKQSRVDLVIKFTVDYSYISLKAGDIVDVTDSRFGFSSKLFRIVTITEVQEDDGPLMMEITALEYDANVYSTADLYKYTRTDENGIVTIGSIGVPGTPQVTKYEIDSRPRVIIESTAPTGVVEGLEYWLSNDTSEPLDENRSYTLIATKRPTGGGTYNSGFNVVLDYDQLDTSNFYVKTRGFNATTVGPYSDPSGLVVFTSTQVTDAIGPDTKVLDSLGGLFTVLSAISLLKSVDELFNGDISSTSSIFRKIFELFEEVTGVDIIDDAKDGNIGEPITIRDEGNVITTATSSINFIGDGVLATAVGNNVTVRIGQVIGPSITSINPQTGPIVGGTEVTILGSNFTGASNVLFDGVTATSFTVVNSGTITATTPPNPVGPADVTINTPQGNITESGLFEYLTYSSYISIIERLPPDRSVHYDPINNATSDTAPITGSYFLRFGGRPFYGPLTAGTGSVKLYKSDGTLVQTLNAASLIFNNEVVELPFSARELGTDYYILADEGVIKYCNYLSPAISLGGGWNFNTPLWANTSYSMVSTGTSILSTATSAVSVSPSGNNACKNADLVITFNREVGTGSGTIYIKSQADDSTVSSLSAGAGTASGNTINYGSLESRVAYQGAYYITADAGVALGKADCYASTSSQSAAITKANGYFFTVTNQLQLVSFNVDSDPLTDTTKQKVNPQSNIELVFNKTTYLGTGTITIYDSTGAVHQAIDVATTFAANKTNELIWTSATSVLINPTKDFTIGKTYYVQAQAGTVKDSCNLPWAGLSDTTTVRFKVDPGPTVASTSTATLLSSVYDYDYDREIQSTNTGTIQIYDGATLVKTIPATDATVVSFG